MKEITLVKAVFIGGRMYNRFTEGVNDVSWLSERPTGVQVRHESGRTFLVPWSNITVAEEE